MKKIYIILINYNSSDHTNECLRSIGKSLNVEVHTLVIDNASTHKNPFFHADHFIQLSNNKGFAGANNIGISYCLAQDECSHILLLNNDTTLEPNALRNLLNDSQKAPHYLYGSRLLNHYKRASYDHIGGVWNKRQACFDLLLYRRPAHEKLEMGTDIDYICGASIFADRKVFEKIGPMDERYFLYFEEADWCQKAKRLGIGCRVCYEAIIYHKGAGSQSSASLTLAYYLTRNRFLYIQNNYPPSKKAKLFFPLFWQSIKLVFQCSLKSFFAKTIKQKERVSRLKAARRGLFDGLRSRYYQGNF